MTGLGTLHIHVTDGKRYVCAVADNSVSDRVEIDFDAASEFETEVGFYNQRVPIETRIQPAGYPDDIIRAHDARMRSCDSKRAAYRSGFIKTNIYLERALGNHAEVRAFLEDVRFTDADKNALLDTLRFKDFADITREVLEDALTTALEYKGMYPDEVWRESVLAPRISDEMLYPNRAALKQIYGRLDSAAEVMNALDAELSGNAGKSVTAVTQLYEAVKTGYCTASARDIVFIALCRANGIAARLNPATGLAEIWKEGVYVPAEPPKQKGGKLRIINRSGETLIYGAHFSIGVLENGAYRSLGMPGTVLKETLEVSVPAGRYRVVTVRRQIDGGIDGRLFFATVPGGGVTEAEISLSPVITDGKLLRVELLPLRTGGFILPARQNEIVAVIAPGEEPTEHFLNELLEAKDEIAHSGIRIRLIAEDPAQADNEKLTCVLKEVKGTALYTRPDNAALRRWRELLRAGDLRLPFAAAVDCGGRGLFAFVNYCVGSVRSLIEIINSQ